MNGSTIPGQIWETACARATHWVLIARFGDWAHSFPCYYSHGKVILVPRPDRSLLLKRIKVFMHRRGNVSTDLAHGARSPKAAPAIRGESQHSFPESKRTPARSWWSLRSRRLSRAPADWVPGARFRPLEMLPRSRPSAALPQSATALCSRPVATPAGDLRLWRREINHLADCQCSHHYH